MSNVKSLFKSLTIFIFLVAVSGQLPSATFLLKAPDFVLRNALIDYIATTPGVDVLKFNKEVIVTIPRRYLHSFKKLGMSANGTDLLERSQLQNPHHYRTGLSNKSPKPKDNANRWKDNNGVRQLMRTSKRNNVRIDFSRQPSYGKIVFYLRKLAKRYPTKIKLKRIGKTVENKYIFIVILFDKEVEPKNGIFLHAGVYGSDWLSVTTVLYLIQELVKNSHSYPALRTLTWLIIPVVNPDGYRYSYKHPEKILSKNRNCSTSCPIGECGVDIFRNFPWNFKGTGSSTYPCSPFYAGQSPLTEIESTVLAQALIRNMDYLKMYIGIRGFGSSILYPWSYSYTPCDDYKDLEALATGAADAMMAASQNPKNYTIGNYGAVTYPSAGSPLDYAKRHLHIKFTYILQMRDRASKKSEVLPVILETFAGIETMAMYVYVNNLPPKTNLRLHKRQRRLKVKNTTGCKIRIAYILFTCHLITRFVMWLYK